MDSHGIDGDRHARIKELVDRESPLCSFERNLANAIGGNFSGGFCVDVYAHAVTGFTLYQSFHYPICSVTYAEPQWQHDSWSTQWRFFELPGIETDCCNTENYANYFR